MEVTEEKFEEEVENEFTNVMDDIKEKEKDLKPRGIQEYEM